MLSALQRALAYALQAFGSATTQGRVHSPEMQSRPASSQLPLQRCKKCDSPPTSGKPAAEPPQPIPAAMPLAATASRDKSRG
jgi:hypothetical protein